MLEMVGLVTLSRATIYPSWNAVKVSFITMNLVNIQAILSCFALEDKDCIRTLVNYVTITINVNLDKLGI